MNLLTEWIDSFLETSTRLLNSADGPIAPEARLTNSFAFISLLQNILDSELYPIVMPLASCILRSKKGWERWKYASGARYILKFTTISIVQLCLYCPTK
jgi:hypothetical protein